MGTSSGANERTRTCYPPSSRREHHCGSQRQGRCRQNHGGGGAGPYLECEFNADDLTATVPVQIGSGGTGGAAVAVDDTDGNPVYLKDIWPSTQEIEETIKSSIDQDMFRKSYADVFKGDERWRSLPTPEGNTFEWDDKSTYVRKAPYFDGMPAEPEPVSDITGARVLALLGDSVTTDHISPAGSIKKGTPAADYLEANGVEPKDFNSLGSRRGNHEVMIRGTFANIRLRNQLLDDVSGGYTRDFTQSASAKDAPQAFIYDASQNYQKAGIPLVVLGGKEYGSGSSRDWAAKGTTLLGVRAVITESFERIHRSNLIGMGVIPLQFPAGESAASLKLDGTETFDITGIEELNNGKTPKTVHVTATKEDGSKVEFDAVVRIDGHHSELAGLFHGHFQASHSHCGPACHMFGQHDRVIHLVDVVTGQDDDVVRVAALDDVDVLVHGVGRPGIPMFADPLLRRQHVERAQGVQAGPVVRALPKRRREAIRPASNGPDAAPDDGSRRRGAAMATRVPWGLAAVNG